MRFVAAEPNNLDWFRIEDNQGRCHKYVRGGQAAINAEVHIEVFPSDGRLRFRGIDGQLHFTDEQAILNVDFPTNGERSEKSVNSS